MNVMSQIAEARASAISLRASARACTHEQGSLKFRLTRAAESLDAIVLLVLRGIEHIELLEQQSAMLERLLRRAVEHDHAAFESGGEVNREGLLAWFAEWREEAQSELHELVKARGQGRVQS